MSVNIAERPTFKKRAVHFDRVVFANVIFLVPRAHAPYRLPASSYIHSEGRISNLIVSVNGHCIS